MANIVESISKIRGKFGFINLVIGAPLLMNLYDYRNVSSALASQFDQFTDEAQLMNQTGSGGGSGYAGETAIVFMGHGTDINKQRLFPDGKRACNQITKMYSSEQSRAILPLMTFEEPGLRSKEEVRLMPFMIVAGDHALNDLTGEGGDSWKSRLEEGFVIDFNLRGMGENDGIAESLSSIQEMLSRR